MMQFLPYRKRGEEESLTGRAGKAVKLIDVACGTGRLTKVLTQMVPSGMVYAADIDRNIIQVAARNLEGCNIKLIEADLSTAILPAKVDVIFSMPQSTRYLTTASCLKISGSSLVIKERS